MARRFASPSFDISDEDLEQDFDATGPPVALAPFLDAAEPASAPTRRERLAARGARAPRPGAGFAAALAQRSRLVAAVAGLVAAAVVAAVVLAGLGSGKAKPARTVVAPAPAKTPVPAHRRPKLLAPARRAAAARRRVAQAAAERRRQVRPRTARSTTPRRPRRHRPRRRHHRSAPATVPAAPIATTAPAPAAPPSAPAPAPAPVNDFDREFGLDG